MQTRTVKIPEDHIKAAGPFAFGDVLNAGSIERLVVEHGITWLVHNSSILRFASRSNGAVRFSSLHAALPASATPASRSASMWTVSTTFWTSRAATAFASWPHLRSPVR